MSKHARWGLLAALLLAGCKGTPDYIEMEPSSHTFKRPGEDLWWRAVAKTSGGKVLHKATAAWSSSDDKVATVDESGRVKAVGPGVATITARIGEVKAEANVEVIAVGKVKVEPAELTLEARGEPKQVKVEVLDHRGRPLTDRMPQARCQNEDVCRTSSAGVHGVDPGQTVLVVSSEGQRTEVPVTVVAAGKK